MVPPPGSRPGAWYGRLSAADRGAIDVLKEWLAPIPWQFFATLEFPRKVRSETAVSKLGEYLNSVERQLRDSICFVAGLEERSKSGLPVAAHFHLLMTASCPIPASLLKEVWWRMVGRGNRTDLLPEGDSVVLKPVDHEREGLAYCLKFANDTRGDWMFNWLEIFNPNIPRSADHREVRRRKRSAANATVQPLPPTPGRKN